MSGQIQDPFFKPIGSLAQATDNLPDHSDDSAESKSETVALAKSGADDELDEERPLEEMESLCMNCHKQVTNSFPPSSSGGDYLFPLSRA